MYPDLDGAYPIVGHLPEMYRRFPALCARGARAHGPLFFVHGGPGARQLMCTDESALAALKEPGVSTSFYAEGFGALLSGTLFAFDGDAHRRVRGLMAPAFTPGRIRKSDVLSIVDDVVGARLADWAPGRRVEVLATTKDIALEIIFRIIGVPAGHVDEWRRQYGRYLLAGVPARIQGPLGWIARRGRDFIDRRLGDLVDRLRASQDEHTLVGAIANRRDEHGAFLDRDLVVANLRLLVLAGHETTAAALAWNLLHLAANPADQRSAREEAAAADPVAVAAEPHHFTFAEAQFREALRLYPAVHSVIRRVLEPLRLATGTIPSGTLLNVPLVHLLRDAQRFPEPERYLPARWQARPRPGTLETAMFGGGPHFCLGYHIAIVEGTLFNLRLARTLADRGLGLRPVARGPLPPPIYLPLARPPRRAVEVVRAGAGGAKAW